MALFTPNPVSPSPWGTILVQAIIIVLVNWVIFAYLIPLLVAPISTIVAVVVVILDILWLLRVAGLI